MKRKGNIMSRFTLDLLDQAVVNASKRHLRKKEVIEFLKNKENEYKIYRRVLAGDLTVSYRYKPVISVSGKKRMVALTSFEDRVLMHVFILLMNPEYESGLSDDCYNCIKGRGINSRVRRYDPVARIKRIINKTHPWGYLQLDIRKCYESTRPDILFARFRTIWKDERFIRALEKLSFCDIGLPIGTPLSPINQHIMMMDFDRFVRHDLKIPDYVRYADDILLFGDKDKLHEAKWRIANYLWYKLGYELKKEAHPTPLKVAPDILGYVFHDGYTRVRKSIKKRMIKSWNNPRSRASYIGITKSADTKSLIKKIKMKLSFLTTDETMVSRRMDSPLIDISQLEGKTFDIIDFEEREPDKKKGKPWMRMQVRFEQDGEKVTRLVKGFQDPICAFLFNMIKYMQKTSAISGLTFQEVWDKTLPIEECEVENDKGWYIKGTLKKQK